ncbi:MAG: hypothetical protein M1820_005971 [Bogoriella megaspora]|nr:MAG: hypothetical protein M1820_005971 [Bogoriella megaspora]
MPSTVVPGGLTGEKGINPLTIRPNYKSYRSPYGPQYKTTANFHGINAQRALRFAASGAGFAAVAGGFALFFFSDVPRVRKDIMEQIPVIGSYFHHEVPPEDDPF